MKKAVLTLALLVFSMVTQAGQNSIRIPILVKDSNTDKLIPSSAVKALGLPETVIMDEKANFSEIEKKLSSKLKGTRFELSLYLSIGDLTGTRDAKLALCYTGNPVVAIELINGMADIFLSDQLQLNYFRVAGERSFHETRENNRIVAPTDESYEYVRDYLKTVLKPGQIQTLTAYTDDGDDTNEDVIDQCR